MSTLSSSVCSELSASASLVDASSASARCEREGFDEESVSLGVPAAQEDEKEEEDGYDDATCEYEDDTLEDNLESSAASRTQMAAVKVAAASSDEDGYSADQFEEQDDQAVSRADLDAAGTRQLTSDGGGSPEDERAFASYGEESFEIDDSDASALLRSVDEAQAGERELELMTTEDRDADAQDTTMDSRSLQVRGQWCADKVKALASRKTPPERALQAPAPAHTLPIEACEALQRQLILRKSKQIRASPIASWTPGTRSLRSSNPTTASTRLPSTILERMLSSAKAKRLLHTTFDTVVSEPEFERKQTTLSAQTANRKCLSTFCAVKRADLESRLATIHFEDRWSHSCTPHASESTGMSIRTLEILQEMMAKQREILHLGTSSGSPSGFGGETLFSCMKTRAANLESSVEYTEALE